MDAALPRAPRMCMLCLGRHVPVVEQVHVPRGVQKSRRGWAESRLVKCWACVKGGAEASRQSGAGPAKARLLRDESAPQLALCGKHAHT